MRRGTETFFNLGRGARPRAPFEPTEACAGQATEASRAWAIRLAASLIGIAKPRPSALDAVAVFTPTTSPAAFRSGPPLLPGLIAASVWIRPLSVTGRPVCSSWTVIVRSRAETIPFVTVSVYVPSGLPIAIAVWPTSIVVGVADRGRLEAGRVDLDEGEVLVSDTVTTVAG